MSFVQRWKPFGLSLIATPFFLLAGLASGGAGHGDNMWAKILFPYTMLSTIFFHSITPVFIVVAFAQYPVYGFILSILNENKFVGIAIVAVHTVSAVLCIILIGESFS